MVKARHLKTFEKAVAEGKADKAFIPFLKKVNASRDYFSSSSCSGRLLLLALPGSGTKKEAYFFARYHEPATFEDIWKKIQAFNDGALWFKMESFILHLGCKDLKRAEKILEVMRQSGLKRGGIMVTKPGKFMVEFQGTEAMSLPVKEKGKVLVDKTFMEHVVKTANQKLKKNAANRKKFERNFLKDIK